MAQRPDSTADLSGISVPVLVVNSSEDALIPPDATAVHGITAAMVAGVTGFGAEVLRIAKLGPAAYIIYAIHLILILTLFIYAPYSKLAHLFYRTAAMVYARHTGRNLKTTA